MSTPKVSARSQADIVRTAITSISTCTSTTINSLQELLNSTANLEAQKENVKLKSERSVTITTASRTKAPPRTKTKTKVIVTEVVEESEPLLSPKERFILATDVVNGTLKSLGDALKSQPKALQRIDSTKVQASTATHARNASSTATRAPLSRTSSYSQRPLQERSVTDLANTPRKKSSLRRSSSYSSYSKSGPAPGLVAIGECARIAFAYLRTSEATKIAGKGMPALQLENGMLALIGKLLAHGLDGTAIKELRILKRRLETFLGINEEETGTRTGKRKPAARAAPSQPEKETLASLLHFVKIESNSSALSLVANYQTHVLRAIAASKKPSVINSVLEHLEFSQPSSPANLLSRLAASPDCESKTARQLESLAQIILSLCPNISSSEDTLACNEQLRPNPNATFQLQALAFQIRLRWWKLAKHQGDLEKELLEPFAKCLSTFARRSSSLASEKYKVARAAFQDLRNAASISSHMSSAYTHISRTLSSLAQSASLTEEALQWTEVPSQSKSTSSSASRSAARLVRCATLSLESNLLQGQHIEIEEPVEKALASLGGNLSGGSNELDTLFTEVVGLRRIATKALSASTSLDKPDGSTPSHPLRLLFSIISGCTRFVARYVGRTHSDAADAKSLIQHGERVNMALKVVKGITESVTLVSKLSVSSRIASWDELDTIIQTYMSVLIELQGGPDANDTGTLKLHRDLQFPHVRISNIYWAYHIQCKKNGDDSKVLLKPMMRSIQILENRTREEMDAGLLGMKFEKIGDLFDGINRSEDAVAHFIQAINYHIDSGILQSAAGLISTTPVQRILELSDGANTLGRLLRSLHISFIRHGVKGEDRLAFFDKLDLPRAERGFLLELQLVLFCKHASKTQHWDPTLTNSLHQLSALLLQLYDPLKFPIRRQRVAVLLIRLAAEKPDLSPMARLDPLDQFTLKTDGKLGEDNSLSKYQEHIHATLRVQLTFRETSPSISKLRSSLFAWQTILDSVETWFFLLDKVDDTTKWIIQLEMISDYFAIKGEEYLRIPVLRMIARAMELKNDSDSTQIVLTLSKLALQQLELGYSGKAGLSLAKAQSLLSDTEATAEARLHWHLAYAKYLLRIGNTDKCESTLAAAERIVVEDEKFKTLVESSKTLAGRVRFNRLLADASHVYSLFAMETGKHDEALRYAKHCVTLNRRCWGTIENKSNAKRLPRQASSDIEIDALTDGVAGLTTSVQEVPQVWSMTHESLSGADFWPHVPSIYRGLSHQSQLYDHQGMFQEAGFYADQAEKVASAVGAGSLLLDHWTKRAHYWANSGRTDKAQDALALAEPPLVQGHIGIASFYLSSAVVHGANKEIEEEVAAYEKTELLLQGLTQSSFIQQLDRITNAGDALADQLSEMRLDTPDTKSAKPARQARGRKPVAKPSARTARKTTAVRAQLSQPSTSEECTPLSQLQGNLLRRKATATLIQNKLENAIELLGKAETLQLGQKGTIEQHLVTFKRLLVQSLKEIATDFTFNTLPESTISFPALCQADRKLSEGSSARSSLLSQRTSLLTASARGKGAVKENFGTTLQKARDCLADIQSAALRTGSNLVVNQISRALSSVTVLLSAANCGIIKGSLHPLCVAYWSELPKQHALMLEQSAIRSDKASPSREELLNWPQLTLKDKPACLSAGQFQRDYIDIIPNSWTVVSLSLSEDHDELYITRYHAGYSPFILRLPMARHNSRDMDEEVFGFEDGKRDLLEIIELSDFSTHSGRDMEAKGAKVEWWSEREALDARLRDLLVNIENIWLGGFRGIFSQHLRQPSLLARFQKSFQNILNQHLPSRQGRGQQKKLNFDPRILELFIGLGDANDEELDLDEPLMDLVYFVVDILQFNGERNAYDEIDFDAMVIDTLDALRAYHSSSQKASSEQTHTILILDKNLHAFPWESLPSLQALSISRLPSLTALRERLCTARPNRFEKEPITGHHISPNAGGTSILNPSGDLTHTQRTLRPHLDGLEGTWNHIIGRAPEEKEFEAALGEKDLLLYFGHGSGAQYIRSRTVKKLFNGQSAAEAFSSSSSTTMENNDEVDKRPGCATALLFGCSSAMVNEHGVYEPSGMLTAYMSAGAPAVLGMLWDVTDKDCDRLAVRTGEIWGLWPEASPSHKLSASTTKEKERGVAGKVRKLVKDVEKARGAGTGKGKGKKADTGAEDSTEVEMVRKRGVGLDEAVRGAREACVLRYLNGAAAVVYGIPVFLEEG